MSTELLPDRILPRRQRQLGHPGLQGERNQALLRPVVQIPLQTPAGVVGSRHDPRPGCGEIRPGLRVRDGHGHQFGEVGQARLGVGRKWLCAKRTHHGHAPFPTVDDDRRRSGPHATPVSRHCHPRAGSAHRPMSIARRIRRGPRAARRSRRVHTETVRRVGREAHAPTPLSPLRTRGGRSSLRDRGRDASQRRLPLSGPVRLEAACVGLGRPGPGEPGQRVRHQRDEQEHADHHPVAQVGRIEGIVRPVHGSTRSRTHSPPKSPRPGRFPIRSRQPTPRVGTPRRRCPSARGS